MLKKAIALLMQKKDLDKATCQAAITEMFDDGADPIHISAFLVLLRAKLETAEELAAIVEWMRTQMVAINTSHPVLDIVGTGGDGAQTVNISTAAAILAASGGARVAKHGNRAFSSLAGSADVLEALGVKIDLSAEKVKQCIDEIGIGFCFAPNFHPMTHKLRPLRKQLGVPTTFNLLGPLLNPAKAAHIVLGVMHPTLMPVIAGALKEIGTECSIVVNGNGLDEISCLGPTQIIKVENNTLEEMILDPIELGFSLCKLDDLKGGTATDNAQIILNVLAGQRGPIADNIILNAAAGLWIYGLYPSINDAIPAAAENLYNGSALKLLKRWAEFSHE
jgi:anthranilate phosphoribosyltransferase